jgi:hypothetical protein
MIDVRKPEEIWKAYEAGQSYKSGIDLYDTVEDNERFYIGDQWHGLNAPNIPKPVLNVLKRTVSMLIAKVCSDDIAANIQPFLRSDEAEERTKMMSREVEKVLELCDVKHLGKQAMRNAAVDGDGCVFTYWDADAPTGQDAKGMIKAELIENINVIFENPHSADVQSQRYIIIARRLPVEEVRERAKSNGVTAQDIDEIQPDDDSHQGEQVESKLVTLLTVLYKQDGTVHAVEATEKVIVRKEWDTELTRYPVAWMPWEKQRNCMHGRAALTDMIPNQIAINKAYAGMLYEIERLGFHTLVINSQFIKGWDGAPGKVLKVAGAPDDVRKYATYIDGAQTNPSISNVIGEVISYTRDFMGTNDASAGNVRPDNASAIIALQNADTVPLELTRQAYNNFIEAIVRNIVDMMHANYGTRLVEQTVTDEMGQVTEQQVEFNFDELSDANLRISVDIGAASMWSEISQMDSINAIFTSGIMDNLQRFRLYLDVVPDKYLNAKAKMLAWIDEQEAAMQQPVNEPYGVTPMEYNYAPTIAQEGYPNV